MPSTGVVSIHGLDEPSLVDLSLLSIYPLISKSFISNSDISLRLVDPSPSSNHPQTATYIIGGEATGKSIVEYRQLAQ